MIDELVEEEILNSHVNSPDVFMCRLKDRQRRALLERFAMEREDKESEKLECPEID